MITLLLVEDEAETRRGLQNFLPWGEIGIGRVEVAANGLAAVDLCESLRPDILLTDVRMPKMDGIQLALYIHERFPMCKVIFISGYSDKEYLKSAIKVGAAGYIEKPVDIPALKMMLMEATEQCLRDQKRLEKEKYQSDVTRKGMPLILQKLAAGACYGNTSSQGALSPLSHLQMDAAPFGVVTMAVKLHADGVLTDMEGEYFREDMISRINGGDIPGEDMRAAACFLEERNLIIHCFFTAPVSLTQMHAAMAALVAQLNEIYKGKYLFTAAAGDAVKSLEDTPRSFQSAQRLAKALFYLPTGVLHTNSVIPEGAFVIPEETENEFDTLILRGRVQEAHGWLNALEEAIRRYPLTEISFVKNLYFNLYGQLSSVSQKLSRSDSLLERDRSYFWQELSVMETLHDVTQYFHTLIDSFFGAVGQMVQAGPAIQEIMDYIRVHYGDPELSIKKIADFSHYDYYYLCALFKKKVHTTINDYIAGVRMEKAAELLKERRIKLQDITSMVGYSDPSYFTKLFKKHMGLTPSEYREKCGL